MVSKIFIFKGFYPNFFYSDLITGLNLIALNLYLSIMYSLRLRSDDKIVNDNPGEESNSPFFKSKYNNNEITLKY